jgi:glutamate-1-semialdehyde 2,1-aminomutase
MATSTTSFRSEPNQLLGPDSRSDEHNAWIAKARELIPGGTTNSVTPPEGLEYLIEGGEGVHLYDVDGRRYLDFVIGAGALILGHAHPRLVDTINKQAAKGSHHFALRRRTVELAERLVHYVPCAEMVRFCSSGTEATFHAIRLSRAITGRLGVIKFDGAWHGHHDFGSVSLEHSPTKLPEPYPVSAGIEPAILNDLMILPFNDAAAVRDALRKEPKRFACVICEPMHRTIMPVSGFLETLREECDRAGVILIFDEVVSGFRVAPGGAQQKYGVTPDVATLGKALSSGMPVSAIVGKRAVMDHMTPGSDPRQYDFHCGTLNGFALGIECAHTTLDILVEEGGIAQLARLGDYARERVGRTLIDHRLDFVMAGDGPLFQPYYTKGPVRDHRDVRASDLKFSGKVHRHMYSAGIYLLPNKSYLSLQHEEAHVHQYCDVLSWAVKRVREGA